MHNKDLSLPMDRQQRKKMKEYIKPAVIRYRCNCSDTCSHYEMKPSIMKYIIKRAAGKKLIIDRMEDFVIETYMDFWSRDKFITPNLLYERALKNYVRAMNRDKGLTTDGFRPKNNDFAYVSNFYDLDGNNSIENIGIDMDGSIIGFDINQVREQATNRNSIKKRGQ